MAQRTEALQAFIDAAKAAYETYAQDDESRRAIRDIFSAMDVVKESSGKAGERLPVCSYLDETLRIEPLAPPLKRMADAFKAIEPSLNWGRRATYDGTASDNFVDGHANAMIVGPGGLEQRTDAWLGLSLLAPNVRYPNHTHAPEEVYLVLSDGEFMHGDSGWFTPGIGGSFYNTPNILHAMRSRDTPLFAFWILSRGDTAPRSIGKNVHICLPN